MKVLEFFSGTECISNAFRSRGHEAFTIDWDEQFPSSLHCDIGKLTSEEILQRFGRPDVIWAAFDCTTFSIAGISHHRTLNTETGNLDPKSEYAKKCDEVDQNVIKIVKELDPKVFIFENPRGGLRKMVWMRDFKRSTTTYCQYGLPYMKPTDFWSNIDLKLKAPCRNGDPCHERAPRGSRTGVQGLKGHKERSVYPELLCQHIVDICEEHMIKYEVIERACNFLSTRMSAAFVAEFKSAMEGKREKKYVQRTIEF